MKSATKILMTAVMGLSLSGAAFAQSSTGGTGTTGGSGSTGATGGSTGSSSVGSQNQTGGSEGTTGNPNTSTATPGSGSTASGSTGSAGAMGSASADTQRDMQRGQMGSDADQKMSAQLDKIMAMPDKASDALFVLDAAASNLYEVEFARIAQQKSQDSQVKELAQMMQKDHTQANEQLRPIAQKMGIELPTQLPSSKQKMLQVKQALNAKDFDTCYVLDNKASHAKSITSFADHQKAAKDDDLKKYITAVLPKLQQHGQHVSQQASSMGFPGAMAVNGTSSGAGAHGAHGSMDASGGTRTLTPGGSGANTDPTDPANNQNPSNR